MTSPQIHCNQYRSESFFSHLMRLPAFHSFSSLFLFFVFFLYVSSFSYSLLALFSSSLCFFSPCVPMCSFPPCNILRYFFHVAFRKDQLVSFHDCLRMLKRLKRPFFPSRGTLIGLVRHGKMQGRLSTGKVDVVDRDMDLESAGYGRVILRCCEKNIGGFNQFLLDVRSYFGNMNMTYTVYYIISDILRYKLRPRSVSILWGETGDVMFVFPHLNSHQRFVPIKNTPKNSVKVLQV